MNSDFGLRIEDIGVPDIENILFTTISSKTAPTTPEPSSVSTFATPLTIERQRSASFSSRRLKKLQWIKEDGELEFFLSGTLPNTIYATLIEQWTQVEFKIVLHSFQSYNKQDIEFEAEYHKKSLWELIKLFLTGWPAVVCFLVQFTLLKFLWSSLPELSSSESGFCQTDDTFLVALLTSFFVNLRAAVLGIVWELYCIGFCEQVYYPDEKLICENKINIWKRGAMLVVWCGEFLILLMIVVVGVKAIFTSSGIYNLIRSALSLVYIVRLNDELASFIYISKTTKHEYICPYFTSASTHKQRQINEKREVKGLAPLEPQLSYKVMSLVVKPVFLLCSVLGIVYSLKLTYCYGKVQE